MFSKRIISFIWSAHAFPFCANRAPLPSLLTNSLPPHSKGGRLWRCYGVRVRDCSIAPPIDRIFTQQQINWHYGSANCFGHISAITHWHKLLLATSKTEEGKSIYLFVANRRQLLLLPCSTYLRCLSSFSLGKLPIEKLASTWCHHLTTKGNTEFQSLPVCLICVGVKQQNASNFWHGS